MNILVCGAGEIGSHAVEVLSNRNASITVIDTDPDKLRRIEEHMDAATVLGNCAQAEVLRKAGAHSADMVLAATNQDEVNLLTASLAKGLGARKTVARIHHAAFLRSDAFYTEHLGIDRLICPEHAMAVAIARQLRNPGAVAIESFARGGVELEELIAKKGGSAIGRRLADVAMPSGSRLLLVRRGDETLIPTAKTVVVEGDRVVLVGNADAFNDARKRFNADKLARTSVILMGGPSMAVWLCRALKDRRYGIRLFETDRTRAEELAEKLDWVTVMNSDPTDRTVFDEESIGSADVFVAMLENDESNIIAGVLAKTRGVSKVMTLCHRTKYLDVVYDVGVDVVFSSRKVTGEEILTLVDQNPVRWLGAIADGQVDVVQVRVDPDCPAAGRPLRELELAPEWLVAALRRGERAFMPGADDALESDDVVLLTGIRSPEATARLEGVFGIRSASS